MKTVYLCLVALGGVLGFGLVGCANESPNAKASSDDPTHRTYTQQDLSRTGRQSTGDAVRSVEPAAQVREY